MTTMDSSTSMGSAMGSGGMTGGEGRKMDDSGMMAMYFHVGVKEYILFQECLTQSGGAMAGACILSCLLAIGFESLRYLRSRIPAASPKISDGHSIEMKTRHQVAQDDNKDLGGPLAEDKTVSGRRHIVISTLHIFEVLLSYCLMLIVMTFNLWLYLAVGVGAGIGYFLFGMRNVILTSSTGNQQQVEEE